MIVSIRRWTAAGNTPTKRMKTKRTQWSLVIACLVFQGWGILQAADVFTKSQLGLYKGEGRVNGVVAGTTFPTRSASARIRVRPNSLIIDGALFRLAGDEIRFKYRELGLSMTCVGTYRKSGRVFTANGTLDVNSAQLAAAGVDLTGFWNYRLVFTGNRVRQSLGMRFPNPNVPGDTVGTISSTATGTKDD